MVSLLFSILSCWFGGGTLFCCVMWSVLLFAVFSSSSQLSGLISTGYKLGLTSNLSGLVWYSSCRLTPVYFCFSHQIFRALKISAFPVLTLTSVSPYPYHSISPSSTLAKYSPNNSYRHSLVVIFSRTTF